MSRSPGQILGLCIYHLFVRSDFNFFFLLLLLLFYAFEFFPPALVDDFPLESE